MFSRRSGWDLAPNALSSALADRRARGLEVLDLTETNPTRCGLGPPRDALREALSAPGVEKYDPDPRGTRAAREAVCAYYTQRGRTVDIADVVLSASTSEAYGWLFKLLCDPGDRVLVPRPGYPLFDYLAELESVVAEPYVLRFDGAWHLDLAAIERALSSPDAKVRAVVVVSPGNPTGAFLKRAELDALLALCAAHDVALICDEVFSDYGLGGDEERVETVVADVPPPAALTFALSGLSKVLALPQAKLGWIVAGGPVARRREALARLEVIADTYLSVGTPAQVALPALFEEREAVQNAILARVRGNLATLRAACSDGASAMSVLAPEGGWSAILRVPRVLGDEAWAMTLLEEKGVLVQPGYYFDFETPGHLVVSLLPGPSAFAEATRRLLEHVRTCATAS